MSEYTFEKRACEIITEQEVIHANNGIFEKSNKAWISGTIEDDFKCRKNEFGGVFYETHVRTLRLSGTSDYVPVVIRKSVLPPNIEIFSSKGKYVEICGRVVSYLKKGADGKKHLKFFLLANTIHICESEEEQKELTNAVHLKGCIHNAPRFRVTPLGRKITELLIRIRRDNGKVDLIPCIAWGIAAERTSCMEVNDKIELYGRIQSRVYLKKYSQDSTEGEYREVYEISIAVLK